MTEAATLLALHRTLQAQETPGIHRTLTTEYCYKTIVLNFKLTVVLPSLDISRANLRRILDNLLNEVVAVSRFLIAILSHCIMKSTFLGLQPFLCWRMMNCLPRMLSAGD